MCVCYQVTVMFLFCVFVSVGNMQFAHRASFRNINFFRMTRYSDPVPISLPLSNGDVLYKHIRGEVYENALGQLIDCGVADFEPEDCSSSSDSFSLNAQSVYLGISMSVLVDWNQHIFPDECNPSLAPVFEDEGSDFCWLKSYGRAPSLPTNCPSGRYFYGGLCYRDCRSGYKAATQIDLFCYQNCPSGYKDTGLFCNNPRPTLRGDQFSNACTGVYSKYYGGLCYHKNVDTRRLLVGQTVYWDRCPSGTWEGAGSCWQCKKRVFGKCIFATIKVPLHKRRHTKCRDGYSGPAVGLCAAKSTKMTCPTGYYNTGLLCQVKVGTPSSIQCDVNGCDSSAKGWKGDGINPIKPSYNRGVGTLPLCDSDSEKQAGLCYKLCDVGYTGYGGLCVLGCPPGYVKCGLGCAINSVTCGLVVGSQVVAVGSLGAAVVDFIAPGTSAAVSASGKAALESAEATVKASVKSFASLCGRILSKTQKFIMKSAMQTARLQRQGATLNLLGKTAAASKTVVKLQKLKTYLQSVSVLHKTVDTTAGVISDEGVSIEDSLAYTGIATTAIGIGGRLVPGVSLALAAVDVALAFASPICWSTLFYQWKQPIGNTDPVASQALEEFCDDWTVFSEDFYLPDADGTETPFNSYPNLGNSKFQLQSVRKEDSGTAMCVTFNAVNQPLKLSHCTSQFSSFKYSYGNLPSRGVVLPKALVVMDGSDHCVARQNNADTPTRSVCGADSLQFEFIPLYDSDESMLLRLLPSSDELCLSDNGYDEALHGASRTMSIAPCDSGSINQWFKTVVVS